MARLVGSSDADQDAGSTSIFHQTELCLTKIRKDLGGNELYCSPNSLLQCPLPCSHFSSHWVRSFVRAFDLELEILALRHQIGVLELCLPKLCLAFRRSCGSPKCYPPRVAPFFLAQAETLSLHLTKRSFGWRVRPLIPACAFRKLCLAFKRSPPTPCNKLHALVIVKPLWRATTVQDTTRMARSLIPRPGRNMNQGSKLARKRLARMPAKRPCWWSSMS